VAFHKDVDPAIDAMWASYDRTAAMDHVKFISQYWRLAGNPGYNATVDRIESRLKTAGIATRVEEYPAGPAWDHSAASLAIVRPGAPDEVVLSRDKDRLTLCINSFSTLDGGITGRLVDVGRGTEQDYAGKELKGAIVLGDTEAGALFRRAVVTGGAAGVVSTTLPGYLNADVPGAARATPRDQWDILQWTSVPYDEARKSFGFKASPRAAATLRKRLADAGPNTAVMVKVNIASSFSTGPARTLVAEIPGTSAPAERIVLAAHIQEPGANDNASGVATLAEMAVAMSTAIKQKKIAAPLRTITFLFLNELSGSRRWIQDHPDEAKQVKYMFSLDMTGEDVSKTGGTFLVERYPDPAAVWERPWDPHSEWGKGNVRAESLKGDLINDVHLTVLRRVAGKSKWVVSSNPYEGGSDHSVFGSAGVPSVLDWHFTDRYYHTNFDTPDKTSPDEMRNVGVGAGATAWLLASADAQTASRIAAVVAFEGERRIKLEQTEGAKLVAAAPDRAAAEAREATIVQAWRKWYGEAIKSVSRLTIGPVSTDLQQWLDRLAASFADVTKSPAPLDAVIVSGPMATPEPPETPEQSGTQNSQLLTQTPIFTCGVDEVLEAPIPVRWSTIVLAGDGRLYTPCPSNLTHEKHREVRELALLGNSIGLTVVGGSLTGPPPAGETPAARRTASVEVVQRAVQAYARRRYPLGGLVTATLVKDFIPACNAEARISDNRRWQPGPLFLQMRNTNAVVRKEAAYGIAVKLSETEGELLRSALIELRACLDRETDAEVQALLLEGWGIAKYANDEQRAEAETLLVNETQKGDPAKRATVILGATKALESLIRLAPRRPVSDAARARLRELALFGRRLTSDDPKDVDARIRRLAMMALQSARDTDAATLRAAAEDVDWQVRRLVAARLNLNDPEQEPLVALFKGEPAFQVRYELVGAIARKAATTQLCVPLVERVKDPAPLVAMRAMDALLSTCTDLDEAVKPLVKLVERFDKPFDTDDWHLSARAFTALARLKSEEATSRLAAVAKQPVWQVRVTAATAAGVLAAEDVAVALSKDEVPNVQNAALEALQRMKSPALAAHAIFVLQKGRDHQLLRTAALVLRGLSAESKEDASEALLGTLRRLTEEESDTSRDPRVAILERLGETLAPQRSTDLLPYVADFDDEVIAAAAKAFQQVVGAPPAEVPKRRRYPLQPTEQALQNLPIEAIIELEEGSVAIELFRDVAPVTIARFAALVAEGAYNNRTFHRVVPNFVVQGGSPGANEYAGATPRFMRDEVGPQASHIRGAVGISTRGRDTGDGQIFIDLVDVPRLDRDYTVFGYVRSGMELVDKLLEGAVIKRITVR
ncbi:MAG TPA: peptidylprolyl isomerase, partial [Vicinamibacterales bacterium]|nr:peptidylprolyl isomerase [Vicinamibacterales bacterium]